MKIYGMRVRNCWMIKPLDSKSSQNRSWASNNNMVHELIQYEQELAIQADRMKNEMIAYNQAVRNEVHQELLRSQHGMETQEQAVMSACKGRSQLSRLRLANLSPNYQIVHVLLPVLPHLNSMFDRNVCLLPRNRGLLPRN